MLTSPTPTQKTVAITVGVLAGVALVGTAIAQESGFWTPFGAGSVQSHDIELPACLDLPDRIPLERLWETAGCDAVGHEVIFPDGDVVVLEAGVTQLNSGIGYQSAVYMVDVDGVAVRWQARGNVQYWGSQEGIRRVIYGEGLPD